MVCTSDLQYSEEEQAIYETRGRWVWWAGEGVMGWQLGHCSAQYAQAPTNA